MYGPLLDGVRAGASFLTEGISQFALKSPAFSYARHALPWATSYFKAVNPLMSAYSTASFIRDLVTPAEPEYPQWSSAPAAATVN